MKKYRLDYNNNLIEVEVIKESEKTFTYKHPTRDKEVRAYKTSGYGRWFDTHQECIDFEIRQYQDKIERCMGQVEYCNKSIEKIKQIKP